MKCTDISSNVTLDSFDFIPGYHLLVMQVADAPPTLLYNTVPMKCENIRSTGLDHRDYINHRDIENIKQEINTASRTERQKNAIITKNARKK